MTATWSYSGYSVRSAWNNCLKLDHSGDSARWGNGTEYYPFTDPERQSKYQTVEDMMVGNGYTLLTCGCWVKGSDEVHIMCPEERKVAHAVSSAEY